MVELKANRAREIQALHGHWPIMGLSHFFMSHARKLRQFLSYVGLRGEYEGKLSSEMLEGRQEISTPGLGRVTAPMQNAHGCSLPWCPASKKYGESNRRSFIVTFSPAQVITSNGAALKQKTNTKDEHLIRLPREQETTAKNKPGTKWFELIIILLCRMLHAGYHKNKRRVANDSKFHLLQPITTSKKVLLQSYITTHLSSDGCL